MLYLKGKKLSITFKRLGKFISAIWGIFIALNFMMEAANFDTSLFPFKTGRSDAKCIYIFLVGLLHKFELINRYCFN